MCQMGKSIEAGYCPTPTNGAHHPYYISTIRKVDGWGGGRVFVCFHKTKRTIVFEKLTTRSVARTDWLSL